MKTLITNTIRISDPTPEIMTWIKMNLTVNNPEFAKRQRMGYWLGNTPRYINLYEIDGNTWVVPYGCLRQLYGMVKAGEYSAKFGVESALRVSDTGKDIPLYDYQQDAVEHMLKSPCGILNAPAGSGKTQMGIALIQRLGKRALWLTHTKDLLNQSIGRASQYIDETQLGKITEGRVSIGNFITFATVQTMCKMDLSEYRYMFDTIIVDEVHRVQGSPTSVTQFYKVLNSLAARRKYGLSATVHRADGMIQATYAMVGGIAHKVPLEAVADKIMPVAVEVVQTDTPQSMEYLNGDGTLNHSKLINYICNDEERNSLIASRIAADIASGHYGLVLSDRIEHLTALLMSLPVDAMIECCMVTGRMTSKSEKEQREASLEEMRSGKKKVLFATYSLAKEGLDIPRLDRLYLTTPQTDYAIVAQSVGRVARTCEGKTDPVAVDFVDGNIEYLRRCLKKRITTYKKIGCTWKE